MVEQFEIRNKKGIIVIISIALLIIFIVWYSKKKSKEKNAINSFFEYEGDNYDGTFSYIGDEEDMYKGRADAYAAKTHLFKVVEPANVLKHERNRGGEYTMIQTGRKYRKGTQFRVFANSLREPIAYHGKKFVQNIKGEFVRLDKVEKV